MKITMVEKYGRRIISKGILPKFMDTVENALKILGDYDGTIEIIIQHKSNNYSYDGLHTFYRYQKRSIIHIYMANILNSTHTPNGVLGHELGHAVQYFENYQRAITIHEIEGEKEADLYAELFSEEIIPPMSNNTLDYYQKREDRKNKRGY